MFGEELQIPAMPIPEMQAPQAPEINKGLWRGFLDKLQTDPNFRQSVLATTTGLMRSPKRGENGLDVFGQAIQSGIGTLQSLRAGDRDRAAAEKQQALQNQLATRQVATGETNAATNARGTDAAITRGVEQTAIEKTRTAQDETFKAGQLKNDTTRAAAATTSAEADMLRAKTTAAGGNANQSGNVQLVNMRAAALVQQNPGLTQEQAQLQAQNELLISKGKSPGAIAKDLYIASVKNWSENLDNIGKQLSAEEQKRMRDEAISMAKELSSVGQPAQPAQGLSGTQPGAQPTPVGPGGQAFEIRDDKGNMGTVLDITNGVARIKKADGTIVTAPEALVNKYRIK